MMCESFILEYNKSNKIKPLMWHWKGKKKKSARICYIYKSILAQQCESIFILYSALICVNGEQELEKLKSCL